MDDIGRFKSALPEIRDWIDKTLDEHSSHAIKVSSIKSSKIERALPVDILDRARVVLVEKPLPVPPLSRMGFPELAELEERDLDGVTYKDTFFINSEFLFSEGLFFHELVHVVQWDTLGVDSFLLAYAAGILQHGYRECPLEKVAYSLRDEFDADMLSPYVDEYIRNKTQLIWSDLLRSLPSGSD